MIGEPNQKEVNFKIARSADENPSIVTDDMLIGDIYLPFTSIKETGVNTEFHFHFTMIKVFAYTNLTKNDKKAVELNCK